MSQSQQDKPRPNKPCPCGSGKKYRDCHGRFSKPRDISLYVMCPEPADGIRIKDGKVEAVRLYSGEWVKPIAFTNISYDRASGKEKVLATIPDYGPVQYARKFLEYSAVFFADTNTVTINGERVSVGCVVGCRAYSTNKATQVRVDPDRRYAVMPARNCAEGQAERRTWAELVKIVQGGPHYRDALRFAIVTDHDHGNHHRYKTGELPIYKDMKLPPNFDLLYMTTDAQTHDGMNKILIEADQVAGRILKELKEAGRADVDGRVMELATIPDASAD